VRRATGLLILLLAAVGLACNYGAPPPTAVPHAVTEPAVPLATATEALPPSPTPVTAAPAETPAAVPTETPTATPEPTVAPPVAPPYGAAVFDDGGNLVYLEPPAPGGEQALLRPLTNSGQDEALALSPDGRRVLFFRTDENWESELWLVNTDGSGETRLVGRDRLPSRQETDASGATVTVGRDPYSVAWLPDNRTVAFNTNWAYDYGLALADDVWLVDTGTLALTGLFPAGLGGGFAFSPDGSWVLLTTPGGSRADGSQVDGRIDLVRADGSGRQTLVTFPMISTASEYQFYPLPRWLPDGSGARVLVPSPAPWEPGAYGTLWAITLDGPAATELGRIPGNLLFQPDPWSPDFSRMAYVAQVGDPASNARELYLAGGSGRDALLYDSGEPVEFSGWSVDGERFLYLKGQSRALHAGQIGGAPQLLLEGGGGGILDLYWLDGDRFLYLAGDYGGWRLMLGAIDGTELLLASPAGDFPSLVVAEKGS
jgi:dipeptidyl aminopeptidase/acylaminoacyl peptidase